ncbi:hypothetical protein OKW50_004224 [Paraburkholderia youngii]
MRADRLRFLEQGAVAVHVVLQFAALQSERCRVDENGRIARVDYRHFNGADAGHIEHVDRVAGRERRAAGIVAIAAGIEEFDLDLRSRKCHPVQFEICLPRRLRRFSSAHVRRFLC